MTLARTLFAVLALSASALAGTTWHVDDSAACPGLGTVGAPFCTIQAALDAAAAGDEIRVAPGTYAELLDFLGKDVELRSTVAAVVTIVDGGGNGSVVSFVGGEGRGALLEGFTLRNGSGFAGGTGGGVTCVGSSPTIRGNVIEANSASSGGGVQVLDGAPLLHANIIRDNTADDGAGIFCQGEAQVEIIGNQIASNGPSGTTGGGIAVNGGSARIEANLIQGNITSGGAGLSIDTSYPVLVRGNIIRANHTDEGDGGGLFVSGALVVVEENEIEDNTAAEGGAVYAYGGTFRGNRITDNLGSSGGAVVARNGASFDGDLISGNAGLLAAVWVQDGPSALPVTMRRVSITEHPLTTGVLAISGEVVFEDCLFADNLEGLGLSGGDVVATLRRCTLSGHGFAAVVAADGSHAQLESCIVWGNAPITDIELETAGGGTIDASWSIVRGGYAGTGNLDADPLFADAPNGDYSLLAGSPAIDSGDPLDGVCGFDLAGTPRRLDGHLDVGSEVDRGALEFANAQLAASEPSAGVLQIDLTGTAGLPAFIFGALSPDEQCLEKWGTFGIDLSGTWVVVPWFPAPSSIQASVAPALSGLPVVLQVLVGAPSGFANTGNLTRAVAIELP